MSIKNEAKIKNPLIVAIREQPEPRALWMYLLCGHAMCGDRGIAESFGCCLELPSTIARGDDLCRIRFVRKKKAFYPAAQYQLEGICLSTRFARQNSPVKCTFKDGSTFCNELVNAKITRLIAEIFGAGILFLSSQHVPQRISGIKSCSKRAEFFTSTYRRSNTVPA